MKIRYTKEGNMKKIILVFILFLSLVACPDLQLGFPKVYGVKYEVTGTAFSVDLRITNENGEAVQLFNEPLPWTYEFEVTKENVLDLIPLYISAENRGLLGSVTTTIYVDDALKESSTESGANATSTVAATL